MRETPVTVAGCSKPAAARLPSIRRNWVVLTLLLLTPASPLLFHHSGNPSLGPYSTDYWLLLGAVVAAAGSGAGLLLALVRNAPARLQLPLAAGMVVATAGALVLLELALGWTAPDPFTFYASWGHERSYLTTFEAKPNHRWEMVDAVYTTDAEGFRTHAAARPPADRERLIVVLGESSAFGYGLNDDETWPHLLEAGLRERLSDDVTVLNAAVNGHNTTQQLIRLHTRILPLHPELVLYYGAINDVRRADSQEPPIQFPRELLNSTTARDVLHARNAGRGWLLEHSLLAHRVSSLIESRLGPRKAIPAVDPPRLDAELFAAPAGEFVRNLRAMHLLCADADVRFLAVTFLADRAKLPVMFRDGLPPYEDALLAAGNQGRLEVIDLRSALRRSALGAVSGSIHSADQSGSDAATAVIGLEALFHRDHYHPSRAGAKLIAQELVEALTPTLARGRLPGHEAAAPSALVERHSEGSD